MPPRKKSAPAKTKRAPRKPRVEYTTQPGVEDYRHEQAKRVNNPPAALASYEKVSREKPKQSYAYDPHLSPQLVWAGKAGLNKIDVEERAYCDVDTVPLYIHERVSAQAIVRAVTRPEMKQLSLFADRATPLHEAVEFYQHEMDWANRLILGDSLLVMNSLLQREGMAGRVQMIYVDPPYGIKFSSNFQPRIDRRDVKDDDDSLTREPEQIQAYRDTWTLGVHSYLTYLRDRLLVARDLLADTGSIFVQISDENLHRVRLLMDEVFGAENSCGVITVAKTSSATSVLLAGICDYLLWYARSKEQVKYTQLFWSKVQGGEGSEAYRFVELPDGTRRPLTRAEQENVEKLPADRKLFRLSDLRSQSGGTSSNFEVEFQGKQFVPGRLFWKTNRDGFKRLIDANRIVASANTLNYVRYLNDFPAFPITNLWDDVGSSAGADKFYVVQTNAKIIARCLLMTTDPGDLVLDPTCGSGTTAFVAEQWGRRWITCDTSRVALSLARQRFLTATFPYYKIAGDPAVRARHSPERDRITNPAANIPTTVSGNQDLANASPLPGTSNNPARGFIYKTVPHITLKSIAQNEPSESETLYDQPEVVGKKVRVAGPFTVEAIAPTAIATPDPSPVAESGGEYIAQLIDLLRNDGVTFPGNKKMTFTSLVPMSGGILHTEGESMNGKSQRVAVSFGPLHGPITSHQVEDGLSEAHRGGFDAVVFCGFAFDGNAQTAIQHDPHPHVRAFMAHIRPDVLMSDLLKTTATSQLFTVFGEPDVAVKRSGDKFVITLRGVDVYDPLTGQASSARAEQIAAWFIDTDYDGRTFCIVQAYFPNKSAWEKLQRALKGTLDEEAFDKLTGTESLPFLAGEHQRAAVKVIDHRGNEVMRVVGLQ